LGRALAGSAEQELEALLPSLEQRAVIDWRRLGYGLTVEVRWVQGVEGLDVVPAVPADNAEVVPRAGAVKNADVGGLVAAHEERLGDAKGVKSLRPQVEQSGIVDHGVTGPWF
jgi:hypothetical protein